MTDEALEHLALQNTHLYCRREDQAQGLAKEAFIRASLSRVRGALPFGKAVPTAGERLARHARVTSPAELAREKAVHTRLNQTTRNVQQKFVDSRTAQAPQAQAASTQRASREVAATTDASSPYAQRAKDWYGGLSRNQQLGLVGSGAAAAGVATGGALVGTMGGGRRRDYQR